MFYASGFKYANMILKTFILVIVLSIFHWTPTECIMAPRLLRSIQFLENGYCHNTTYGSQYAIIVHGWRETCNEPWSKKLAENLQIYRGGCIICMDYRRISSLQHYLILTHHTNTIARVLARKLQSLEHSGFNPNKGYMFGFSLGGRIALAAGRIYGKQKIAEIDTCDMAGPGFDFIRFFDPKLSAQNVQCIHTSFDKGTHFRNCHQNWNMGVCGARQEAAGDPPFGSHGLCPVFYNAAFRYAFYAESNPRQCDAAPRMQRYWPKKFRMGYMERRKFGVRGQFYASTTRTYPFSPHTFNFIPGFFLKRPHESNVIDNDDGHNNDDDDDTDPYHEYADHYNHDSDRYNDDSDPNNDDSDDYIEDSDHYNEDSDHYNDESDHYNDHSEYYLPRRGRKKSLKHKVKKE